MSSISMGKVLFLSGTAAYFIQAQIETGRTLQTKMTVATMPATAVDEKTAYL